MSNFQDIVDFLAAHPPFNQIDASALEKIAGRIAVTYFKAGETVNVNEGKPHLHVIRSGSVEIRSHNGLLLDRLSNGGCFGYGPMLTGDHSSRQFTMLEDGLVYLISQDDFSHLRHHYAEFDFFFARETRRRAETQSHSVSRDIELSLKLEQIMQTNIVTAGPMVSITHAANIMTNSKVSSLLICDDVQHLLGVITDRDLRTRVVAPALDLTKPVKSVMSTPPLTLSPKDTVHQAYLTMMSANIHHLPITDNGKAVGIISLSDLIRSRNSEPLFLIQAIKRVEGVDELKEVSEKFPGLIEKLIVADVHAEEIGRIITTLTDSLTQRLLLLGQQTLGCVPCAFTWLAFGSQGRKEQTLNSDQDNGLLLDDSATDSDINYFLALAKFVCDGLDHCGIRHCPGEVMAMNPKWCLRLSQWQKQFFHWIAEPSPKALMHASIFYDMRNLSGNETLFSQLQSAVFERVKNNSIFLACMLENALSHSPPLGFFKTFVLERDGDHNSVLDLKHRGTIPIVDIARLYSLSEGIRTCNTLDRLRALKQHKVLHAETADNLCDAHEFIANIRLDNQHKQVLSGHKASNNLDPKLLSPLTRHQLKDAFAAVQECQQAAKIRFGRGVL